MPTLVEQGYDVVLSNWRGVAGPANAAPELRGRLEELIARLHASAPWRAALGRFGWRDLYLPARDFEAFLRNEQGRVEAIILSLGSGADVAPLARGGAHVLPALIGLGLVAVSGALLLERRRTLASGTAQVREAGSARGIAYVAFGALASLATIETAGFFVSPRCCSG